jgi:tRNA(fMet)-specific endonuclease VapC
MSFLLDTDICSTHLKNPGRLTSRFLQHSGRLRVSVVTLGEILTWALRSNAPPERLQGVQELLKDVVLLEITEDVACQFGQLRASLLDAGRPTPEMDLWIAATALVNGLVVVTHNVQDFAHIPGLTVNDWLAS